MTTQFFTQHPIEAPAECLQQYFIPLTISSTEEILPKLKVIIKFN